MAEKKFVVVVAYDMSAQADLALIHALELAQHHDHVDLHVLGVLDSRPSLGFGSRPDFKAAEDAQAQIREKVKKILPEIDPGALDLFVHARIGSPAKEIVNLAEEAEADLLVVGTHGRQGMDRWLLGSVAEKVVRHANCPVLVARPRSEHLEAEGEFQPEPACPACVEARKESDGQVWWCEQHSHKHIRPHALRYSNRIAQTRPSHSPIS
jgi:nucleotide-binding universal stress UspA family protein